MARTFYVRARRCRQNLLHASLAELVGELEALEAEAPAQAAAWFQRGEMWLALGRTERALPCLEQSLAARPGFLPARILSALALCDAGRPDEAQALTREILAARPGHEFARSLLAYAQYRATGRTAELAELAASPFLFDQHLGGRLLHEIEEKELANSRARLADLFAELQVSPLGRWLHPLLRPGRRLATALQHPLSERRRSEAIALSEATGLLAVGRPREAAAALAGWLKVGPTSTAAGLVGAEVLLAAGELTALESLLGRLAEREPELLGTPEHHLFHGILLAERGAYREAEAALLQLPDDPWNFFPAYYLGLCATGQGRAAEARRRYARALETCTLALVHRRLARRVATSQARRRRG